jgi:putative FmdB family regulatory protein
MPAYVYRCRACDAADLEVVHSIHDDPEFVCECGELRRRVVFSPGVSLKGDGWAGKTVRSVGVEGKVPPARPVEFGGTLDTGKRR